MVAFAATLGVMPLEMPESVLVRFSGELRPGITIRDLVHAIPYFAMKQDLLTLDKKTKKTIVRVDSKYYRPSEVDTLLGDSTKARKELGWTPKISFKELVEDMCKNGK